MNDLPPEGSLAVLLWEGELTGCVTSGSIELGNMPHGKTQYVAAQPVA